MIDRGNPLLKHTENVPDSCQTRACHESETFNVWDKTLRERKVRHVENHDDSSHEQWWTRWTWTSEFQDYHILLWSMHRVPAFENWFRKLRTTQIDTLFNQIYDKIKPTTRSVQSQNGWFRTVMWNFSFFVLGCAVVESHTVLDPESVTPAFRWSVDSATKRRQTCKRLFSSRSEERQWRLCLGVWGSERHRRQKERHNNKKRQSVPMPEMGETPRIDTYFWKRICCVQQLFSTSSPRMFATKRSKWVLSIERQCAIIRDSKETDHQPIQKIFESLHRGHKELLTVVERKQ